MMVIAQTINPGIFCMHGGIPGVTEAGGDLSYSSSYQPLINAALARVNTWITRFPSAQSGGSLKAIQTASIATAFPLMFLLLVSVLKQLLVEYRQLGK